MATLPTQLGTKLDILARIMDYKFHRPAHTGEALVCEVTIEHVEELPDRYKMEASAVCRNEAEETVMTASFEGVVLKER